MNDGRVIFTGGVSPGAGGARTWLEAVEGINPQSWSIGEGPPARAFGAEPRAWHGAVKLKDGRLLIFGVILIVMMRFRPAGLLPEARQKHEIEAGMGVAAAGAVKAAGGANVAPRH